MIINGYNFIFYTLIFISLFLIDYILGKGFVDMFTRMFCKVACFVKKSVREEAQLAAMASGKDSTPISITMLMIEIMLLTFTVGILNRYKTYNRGKDRIDELLKESKDALQTTNEFLEKWRLRRINQVPTQYSYLDEEPQEIKPLQLEVPLLHMAIVDALVPPQLASSLPASTHVIGSDTAMATPASTNSSRSDIFTSNRHY